MGSPHAMHFIPLMLRYRTAPCTSSTNSSIVISFVIAIVIIFILCKITILLLNRKYFKMTEKTNCYPFIGIVK